MSQPRSQVQPSWTSSLRDRPEEPSALSLPRRKPAASLSVTHLLSQAQSPAWQEPVN